MKAFSRIGLMPCFLLLLVSSQVLSQKIGDLYPESNSLILKGVKHYDAQEYNEAIQAFLQVENGDSLYYTAQYELALTYQADSQFVKALECIERIIDQPSSSRYIAKLMKGDLLDYMDKPDESIAWFDGMIAECDYFNRTYYEKGITLLRQKKYEAALKELERSFYLNPFHARTHMQIGVFAAEAGQPALAIMASVFASILESRNPSVAYTGIMISEQVGQDQYQKTWKEISPKTMAFAEEMDGINEIVRSKAALSPKYKSKVKGNYTHVKQLQVICEKLPASCENDNALLQFYTRFYKRMWDQGHFVGMALDPLQTFNDPTIQSLIKKNAKKINAFEQAARQFLDENSTGKQVTVKGQKKKVDFVFDDGQLLALADEASKDRFQGDAMFFYSDGIIQAEGKIVNGMKDGLWRFYNQSGIISKTEEYKNNIVDGNTTIYDDYGRIRTSIQYKNGKEDGRMVNYHTNGSKENEFVVVNGKIDGEYIQYDKMQNKEVVFRLKDNQLTDKLVYYNRNGSVSFELPVVNGDPSGYVKNLNENGIVVAEGNMRKKERDGEWKLYHVNGKLSEKGSYELGEKTGVWEVYDEEGRLVNSETFKNDKLSGKRIDYDRQQRKLSEITFRNGRGIDYTYFDVNGQPIQTAKTSSGKLHVVNYNELRIRSSEGDVDDDKRVGLWKEYYANGSLKSEVNYKENLKDGLEKIYYPTGELKAEYWYKEGLMQGYFRIQDVFGNLTDAGYTKDGELHGPRMDYYANGQISNRAFFWKGEICGDQIYYTPGGRIERINRYQDAIVTELIHFDSTGHIIGNLSVNNGNGPYQILHCNGKKLLDSELLYNELHGEVSYYNPEGKVDHVNTYKYGQSNGQTTQYHHNGQLASTGMMVNGSRDGEWTFYHTDGKMQSKGLYKDGDRHGKMTFYHRNGKVYQDRNYFHDDRDGVFKYYAEDGSLIIQMNYSNGVLLSYTYEDASGKLLPEIKLIDETGKIEARFASGKPSIQFSLKKGEFDGDYIVYHSNGKIHEKFHYTNGENTGLNETYNSKGVKIEEENYLHGHLQGVRKEFHENGKLSCTETMVAGEKYGPAAYYDSSGKLISEGNYFNGYFYKK